MKLPKLKLDTFYLKLIAIIFMVIDHIAHILIPTNNASYWLMRMAGRIAAPIFMYCFAIGYKNTSNRFKYQIRLALSAVMMSLVNAILTLSLNVFDIAIDTWAPNMFLTFFFMTITIDGIEKFCKKKNILYVLIALISLLITGLKAEYGWYAVCTILPFYFIKNKNLSVMAFVVLNTILCILMNNFVQFFMILAALPIVCSVQDKPRKQMKWFFYIFYPLHFVILIIIRQFL